MNAFRIALNIGSIALIAMLGWLCVRIFLGVTQPASLYAPAPIVPPAKVSAAQAGAPVYDFSSDPFTFGEIVIDPMEFLEDVPETTLDLKLKGIVSESNATFRMSNGQDKAVEIGEEVMNNVVLQRTAKDFVMLDVNGDAQKLTLERKKLGEKNDAQPIIRAASTSATPSRESVEDFFSKLRLKPSIDRSTKQMQGFQINARPGADLAQFKLKSGDVLTRVGPVLLNTTSVNIRELRDLVTSGGAQDFEVIRDGTPMTIRIGQ